MDIGFKRLFITTRPEIGEILENLTSSLRMKFVAFEKNYQEQLLSNLLKDNSFASGTECKKLVSKVVSKLSENERAFHHNLGTPLILKLLAEILSSFEDDGKRLYKVDKINLNIYQLYRQYLEVKMRAYYKSDEKNLKSFESFKTEMMKKLETLAVQQIFPEFKTSSNKQKEIRDNDLFYLSPTGFIQQIKQRTLAEFLVVKNLTYLTDSLWEKLFHDPEFSAIRSFLASWMEIEGMNKKIHRIHEKILKDFKSFPNIISTLLIEDKNVRDFEVFLKTFLKIGGKRNEEESIQILVKNFDENSNNCSIISYYFKNYEVDSEIFEKSVKLLKEIINPKFSYNEFNDYNLLMISSDNFHNIFAILKLLKTNFKNEDKILHDFLTYREPETMKNFLQILIENSANTDQEKVMHVIEKLHELDIEILKEIVMNRDWANHTIFHLLILKQAPVDYLTKVLFWVQKVCGLQVFEELLLDPSIFNTDWLIGKQVPFDCLVHIVPEIINLLSKTFSQNYEVKPFELSKKMARKLLHDSYKEIDFEFHEIFFKLEIVKKFENNTKFFNTEIERIFLASYLYQSEDLLKEKPEKLIVPALKKILATEFSFKKAGEERDFLKIWERMFEDKGYFKKFTNYMENDKDEILNLLEKRELFDILRGLESSFMKP